MPNFMGIDGGGTSCRARIRNSHGTLLAEAFGGPANIYQDFAGALKVVLTTASSCAAQAGIAIETLHAGIGLAGVSDAHQMARFTHSNLPFHVVRIESDGYIACLGAHGGGDGGVVIAGTGSAGLALVQGQRLHVGGHGFSLGDHGSGAVIGRAGLRAALLAADGLAAHTRLTQEIMEQFGNDTTKVVDWSRHALSGDYAKFAPQVLKCAQNNDTIAREIVSQAMVDLSAIAKRLQTFGATRMSLVGSIGTALLPMLDPQTAALFATPLADPLDGAIAMVQK